MKNSLLIVIFLIVENLSLAQTVGIHNDPNWEIKWKEEFNFNQNGNRNWGDQKRYLELKGWDIFPDWWSCYDENYKGNNLQFPDSKFTVYTNSIKNQPYGNNIKLSNGVIELILRDQQNNPYTFDVWADCKNPGRIKTIRADKFTSGWIHLSRTISNSNDMDYGYYELRFNVPKNVTNQNQGIQTNWWTFGADSNSCWSEVDFFEMSGFDNRITQGSLWSGRWKNSSDCAKKLIGLDDINFYKIWSKFGHNGINEFDLLKYRLGFIKLDDERIDSTFINDNWHIMSCEVMPCKINWYLDGIFLRSTISYPWNLNIGMLTVMEQELSIWWPEAFYSNANQNTFNGFNGELNSNTKLPYSLKVDYLRFYKAKCGETTSNQTMTSLVYANGNFQPGFYKNVVLGYGNIDKVGNGQNIHIRAIEFAEFGNEFEVENGGELYVDICDCRDQ